MKNYISYKGKPSAGRLALRYALFGLLWILFSDGMVFYLFPSPAQGYLAQNLKGLFYILVTTLLVYSLVKKSISTIRHQEAKVRLLAENTQDVIWSLDMSWRIVYINPAIESLVGIPAERLLGEHVACICTQKSLAQLEENITTQRHKGPESKGVMIESELLHRDGTVVPVEINGRLMYNEHDEACGIQGVTRDIRQRHALQAQLRQAQKMESIGTMASGIAHEVNNPITIISASAELLAADETRDKEDKKILQQIVEQSGHIHQIITNLLGFARMEESSDPKMLRADIPLRKCLELMQTTLRHEQILLHNTLPEAPPDLLCFPHQIQQVLINLMQNARDSLNERFPEAHPDKQLIVSLSASGTGLICYTIKDAGMGMNLEQLEKIFDPFFTTKPEGKGTGLGMWISHQIVKHHRGSIIVESEPLHYTQIEILLPQNFQTQPDHCHPTIQIRAPQLHD